jgi:glutamate dehydrogenase
MPPSAETSNFTLLDTVAALVDEAPSGRRPGRQFIRDFYRNVPPDDLMHRSPADLLSAAAALWQFMAERRPGRAKLSVLAPHEPENAWTGGRTIIQICNDDMPFLVDSVTAALNRLDLVVHLVIHPVLALERDSEGRLEGLGRDRPGAIRESVMQIELAGPVGTDRRDEICTELETILADVRAAVVDWNSMRKRVDRIAGELGGTGLPVSAAEAAEVSGFLSWLGEDNFTFLGYREYEFGGAGLTVIPGVGRGLLRNDNYLVFDGIRNFTMVSPDVQSFLRSSSRPSMRTAR